MTRGCASAKCERKARKRKRWEPGHRESNKGNSQEEQPQQIRAGGGSQEKKKKSFKDYIKHLSCGEEHTRLLSVMEHLRKNERYLRRKLSKKNKAIKPRKKPNTVQERKPSQGTTWLKNEQDLQSHDANKQWQ